MTKEEKRKEIKFGNELPSHLPKIGLIGLGRSGKGAICAILAEKYNFRSIGTSSIIREYAAGEGIKLATTEDYWRTREEIIGKYGEDYILEQSLKKLREEYDGSGESIGGVIFDGIRIFQNAVDFKALPNSVLIAVQADADIRYQRVRPERPEDQVSKEVFTKYDEMERQAVDKIMRIVDPKNIIINDGTLADLESKVAAILNRRFKRSPIK